MITKPIKRGVNVLLNPEIEFKAIEKRTLEDIVSDYMRLLIAAALAAGIFNFIITLIKAIYLDIFVKVVINYWRVINYSLGISTSITFFYVFAGTFIVFFISTLLNTFFRKLKYALILKILLYSLFPLLLFGWIFINPLPLLIWCIFLLYVGFKINKHVKIKKDSIHQRD